MIKIQFWFKKLGVYLQTHRDYEISWVIFYEACAPLQWAHLPGDQVVGKEIRPG